MVRMARMPLVLTNVVYGNGERLALPGRSRRELSAPLCTPHRREETLNEVGWAIPDVLTHRAEAHLLNVVSGSDHGFHRTAHGALEVADLVGCGRSRGGNRGVVVVLLRHKCSLMGRASERIPPNC